MKISIHALREEGDFVTRHCLFSLLDFYPRPPRGGRRSSIQLRGHITPFLSTPSARRATGAGLLQGPVCAISIHALREEGDAQHILRITIAYLFLSTPSARRATTAEQHTAKEHQISIHALREEGDCRHRNSRCRVTHFYPRPPRGGRQTLYYPDVQLLLFLSTPSARRATQKEDWTTRIEMISIHALREEGDPHGQTSGRCAPKFLSTPSARRATVCAAHCACFCDKFLSTPSARRATSPGFSLPRSIRISIHALREEGDFHPLYDGRGHYNFYPRPPRGGRPLKHDLLVRIVQFLSTPSARRATAKTEKKSLLLFHYKLFCTKWKELQLCRTRKVRILWQKHPFFRCEENGKSMSACASHTEKSEDQRAVLLETGVKADVLDL